MQFSKEKIGGYIAGYNLSDWWLSSFTEQEIKFMVEKYDDNGMTLSNLTSGKPHRGNETTSSFLSSLSDWFNAKAYYDLCLRIIQKAEVEFIPMKCASDYHFYLLHMIKFYYKNRDRDNNMDVAINYCEKQIELAPETRKEMLAEWGDPLPSHTGFEQLAIVYEKQKEYQKSIDLCRLAKKQGWSNDWEKRIVRCTKKQAN